MPRRRAMTSEVASLKKIAGHVHEDDFANLIGGSINKVGKNRIENGAGHVKNSHELLIVGRS